MTVPGPLWSAHRCILDVGSDDPPPRVVSDEADRVRRSDAYGHHARGGVITGCTGSTVELPLVAGAASVRL